MIYRVVTYDRATERIKGSLVVPPSVLGKVKKIAGFQPEDDGRGEYPLDEKQTGEVGKILGFKAEAERFFYTIEPHTTAEDNGFQASTKNQQLTRFAYSNNNSTDETSTTRPLAIAEVFDRLKTEIVWVNARWLLYKQLYGASERRIDLLNESAAIFFYVVQETFLADVYSALSKLSDPPQTGQFSNLSLEQLQLLIESRSVPELSKKTRVLLDKFHQNCQPFRVLRNKKLAHFDLEESLKDKPSLPSTSRAMVNHALDALSLYMNEIQAYYEDSETAYGHFIMSGSDGEALIYVLKAGLRYSQLLREGVVSWSDLQQADWLEA